MKIFQYVLGVAFMILMAGCVHLTPENTPTSCATQRILLSDLTRSVEARALMQVGGELCSAN